MIEINLLPKGYLKGGSNFSIGVAGKYVVAGGVGLCLILCAITFYQMGQVSELEENIAKANRRAETLRQDIRMVDALTEVKGKITQRMTTVERLDRHRSAWVRILEDLASNVPEFVWLGQVSETGGSTSAADTTASSIEIANVRPVQVQGYSFTLNALAAFMIKMMRSDYFDSVELVSATEVSFDKDGRIIRSKDRNSKNQRAYDFTLSCNVHYLSDEELRNMIAAVSDDTKTGKNSHRKLN